MNDDKTTIPYIIAVDFDGTLFERKWPLIGAPNLELIRHLKNEQNEGSRIILWTCRTGEMLEQAVKACKQFGLIFDAVNDNIPEIKAIYGNDSRKITACEYIDDLMSTKFVLPFVGEKGITDDTKYRGNELSVTDEDIKTIERLITSDGNSVNFKDIKALTKMNYDIYKRLMTPVKIL